MLPTFVIGLREGLEAALIIGIVAAFLRRNGRARDLWKMWLGVAIAVSLCTAVAIGLRVAERRLPQKQQEGLETIIGLIAVAFVTWMIVWMRNHAHEMKGEIESHAASALQSGSAGALIAMAFLAVLREGLETAVFLLALLNSSGEHRYDAHGRAARHRGRVRDRLRDLSRRREHQHGAVLQAHRLRARARRGRPARQRRAHRVGGRLAQHRARPGLRTSNGWSTPGSVRAALLTGMFGLQPRPARVEVVVWLAYAIPMSIFVLLPRKPKPKPAPEPESKPALAV